MRCTALALLLLAAGGSGAADVIKGGELYAVHCASCHGASGVPVLPATPDLTQLGPLMRPDGVLLQSIRRGTAGMPGYQGILRDTQILDLIAYMRTLQR